VSVVPSPRAARIVLVGFMGAGKSTVGPILAGRLGWEFLDLDAWIEEKTGMSVAALFRERGEAAFRDEERAAAEHALTRERLVVAAGGGAFTQPATRRILQQGHTVWLRCEPLVLFDRIPSDGTRPLAENRDIMTSLLAERESSYRLADCTVDTSTVTPDQVARRIVEALFERVP
jgi:shikimate kinase/3-dehydroquinate synthase